MKRTRVFVASSLDGFIAGPNHELDWLEGREGVQDTFAPFFEQIGAMLVGRRTFDVASGFDTWPYGTTPIIVATTRPLATTQPSVRTACDSIHNLVDRAKQLAGQRDVYVDGGVVIRSAMDADLIDEITITVIPIVLGAGVALFAGANRHGLALLGARSIGGGLVELKYAPQR